MNLDKNPLKITNLFNDIASCYDMVNDIISFKTHYFIKIFAVKLLEIKANSNILDVCCGTGDFVQIISKTYPNCEIKGLDISSEMLKIAKIKNPNKKFILSDCTKTSFQNNEFDYITMGFGLRNIKDRKNAVDEIYRILKPEGKFLHLDFGEHNFFSYIFNFTTSLFIKLFIKHKEHYKYLIASKNAFLKPDELINELKNSGFKKCFKKYFLFKTICVIVAQK